VSIGIVVIGRNEGPRLLRSLNSVAGAGCPVVYVDSGSRDGSLDAAKRLGVEAISLSTPFTAARARNHGFATMMEKHPPLKFVQFLDGDCALASGWLHSALLAFAADPQRALVFGHLAEYNSASTPYKRLCALEWRAPAGDLAGGAIGGVFAVRVCVFKALDGFREDMVAGEDSELGVRVRLAGHKITKIDASMAEHDADIRSFAQWWKRAVRAGHAIGQRYEAQGASAARDCVKELRSTVFWGIVLPLVALLGAPFSQGLSLVLLLGYPVLLLRVHGARRRMGDSPSDAFLYALFIVIGKFANIVGLAKFAVAKRSRGFAIIEYK
jgi:GT2 family glycosyltransferase